MVRWVTSRLEHHWAPSARVLMVRPQASALLIFHESIFVSVSQLLSVLRLACTMQRLLPQSLPISLCSNKQIRNIGRSDGDVHSNKLTMHSIATKLYGYWSWTTKSVEMKGTTLPMHCDDNDITHRHHCLHDGVPVLGRVAQNSEAHLDIVKHCASWKLQKSIADRKNTITARKPLMMPVPTAPTPPRMWKYDTCATKQCNFSMFI